MKTILTLTLLGILLPLSSMAQDATGFVNDQADVLSPAEEQHLEDKLKAWQKETTNELAVLTISSLDGEPIEDYANTFKGK